LIFLTKNSKIKIIFFKKAKGQLKNCPFCYAYINPLLNKIEIFNIILSNELVFNKFEDI